MSPTVASGFTHEDQTLQSRLNLRASASEPPPSSRDRFLYPSNAQPWSPLNMRSSRDFTSEGRARPLGSNHGTDNFDASMSSRKPARSVDLIKLEDLVKATSADTRSSGQMTDGEAVHARFACPYFKCTGQSTSSTCAGPGWPTVHRVKEHLYRVHRLHQCDRCREVFQGPEILTEHRRAVDPCSIKAFDQDAIDPTIGMTESTFAQVKKRSPRSISESEKWTQMYKVLFGETEKVPSPYYEQPGGSNKHGDDGSSKVSSDLRERLAVVVRQLLTEAVEPEMSSIESKLLESIPDIVRRAIDILLETPKDEQLDGHSVTGGPAAFLPPKPGLDETSSAQKERLESANPIASSTSASTSAVLIPISAKPMSSHEYGMTPEAISSLKNEDGFSTAFRAKTRPMRSRPPANTRCANDFYCPYCLESGLNKVIKTKHDWKRHIVNFHEDSEEWQCVCGLNFHSESKFRNHNRKQIGHRLSYHRDGARNRERVYACGYTDCTKAYACFRKWCNHVADEMRDIPPSKWDYSWRIRNILRFHDLTEAWHKVAEQALQGTGISPNDLTWEPSQTRHVLHRLETYCSDEDPHALLQALFSRSRPFPPYCLDPYSFLTGRDFMHGSAEMSSGLSESLNLTGPQTLPEVQDLLPDFCLPAPELPDNWMDWSNTRSINQGHAHFSAPHTPKDTSVRTVGLAISK